MKKTALYLLIIVTCASFGCEKEAANADSTDAASGDAASAESPTPDAENIVQPKFSVDERHELKATVVMKRVMTSEARGEREQPSEPLEFLLTVEPKGDEVHFYWAPPEVAAMPRETDEEKEAYLKANFETMWSPSFAVSKQGKFLRILDKEAIRKGFDASMEARIEAGADRAQIEKMAETNDPVEVMTEVGERRWNEIVGHFLVNEFVLGDTIKAAGAEYTATRDIGCESNEPGGECVRFQTQVPVSRREVEQSLGDLSKMSTELKEARREAVLVARPDTMLPWYSESTLHLEMVVSGEGGSKDNVTSRTIETIDITLRDGEATE